MKVLNRAILYAIPMVNSPRPRTAELLPSLQTCLCEWILAIEPARFQDSISLSMRILCELVGELSLSTVEELKRQCDQDETPKEIIAEELAEGQVRDLVIIWFQEKEYIMWDYRYNFPLSPLWK